MRLDKDFYTIKEVAQILRISEWMAGELTRTHKIGYVQSTQRRKAISKEHLEEYLNKNTVKAI